MPNSSGSLLNRTLLGGAGLGLSDSDYVEVIAGLGAFHFNWASSDGSPQQALGWSAQKFLTERTKTGISAPPSAWLTYREAWRAARKAVSPARVLIRPDTPPGIGPDLAEVARVLSRPATGAESLFIDRLSSPLDLHWQWPMRIGACAEDFEALELARLQDMWPANSLSTQSVLTRDAADVEVLILKGDLRAALTRILTLDYPVRARYIMVLGPVASHWHTVRPIAEALLSETQARGLALFTPDENPLVDHLNRWIEVLAHNTSFDVAYAFAFPPARSLIMLDRRLIEATALPVAVRTLARRLQQMPPAVLHSVSSGILDAVGLGSANTRSAPMLGAVLGASGGALPYTSESLGASAISKSAPPRARRSASSRTPSPAIPTGNRVFL